MCMHMNLCIYIHTYIHTAAARPCRDTHNATESKRERQNSLEHRRSALWPMTSPVENSATPGATGAKSAPLRPPRSPNI